MNKKPFKNPKYKSNEKAASSSSGDDFFITKTIQSNRKTNDNFFVKAQKSRKSTQKINKSQDGVTKKTKKPFDKKQWRLKKYSNKYKVEEWESKRKEFMTRRYNKELKKQSTSFDVQKIYEEEANSNVEEEKEEENLNKKKKTNRNFKEAVEDLQTAKEKRREEAEKRRAEKKAALEAYKKRKIEKNRILSKRTNRGQPIMKGRLELLLQQIQEGCDAKS